MPGKSSTHTQRVTLHTNIYTHTTRHTTHQHPHTQRVTLHTSIHTHTTRHTTHQHPRTQRVTLHTNIHAHNTSHYTPTSTHTQRVTLHTSKTPIKHIPTQLDTPATERSLSYSGPDGKYCSKRFIYTHTKKKTYQTSS